MRMRILCGKVRQREGEKESLRVVPAYSSMSID